MIGAHITVAQIGDAGQPSANAARARVVVARSGGAHARMRRRAIAAAVPFAMPGGAAAVVTGLHRHMGVMTFAGALLRCDAPRLAPRLAKFYRLHSHTVHAAVSPKHEPSDWHAAFTTLLTALHCTSTWSGLVRSDLFLLARRSACGPSLQPSCTQ